MTTHPFGWWLAACGGLTAAYLWLPQWGQGAAMVGLGASITGLLVARARRSPDAHLSWRLFAAGTGAWSLGLLLWVAYATLGWGTDPLLADLVTLAGYVMVTVGLVLLSRGPHTATLRTLMDLAIVVLGAATVVWVGVLGVTAPPDADRFDTILTVSYPVLDLALLAGVALVIMSPMPKPRGVLLMLTAAVAAVASSLSFAWLDTRGLYEPGHAIDLGWFLAFALIGAAALADTRPPPAGRLEVVTTLSWRRSGGQLVILSAAAMTAPAALVAHALQHDDVVLAALAVASLAALALVLARAVSLTRVVTAQADQLAVQSTTDQLTGVLNRRGLEGPVRPTPDAGDDRPRRLQGLQRRARALRRRRAARPCRSVMAGGAPARRPDRPLRRGRVRRRVARLRSGSRPRDPRPGACRYARRADLFGRCRGVRRA